MTFLVIFMRAQTHCMFTSEFFPLGSNLCKCDLALHWPPGCREIYESLLSLLHFDVLETTSASEFRVQLWMRNCIYHCLTCGSTQPRFHALLVENAARSSHTGTGRSRIREITTNGWKLRCYPTSHQGCVFKCLDVFGELSPTYPRIEMISSINWTILRCYQSYRERWNFLRLCHTEPVVMAILTLEIRG